VLLDCVLSTAERWLGPLSASALRHAKFASMLLPEQAAELELQLSGEELRFAITRDGHPLAQGAFTVQRHGAAV
jgi:hypothetical protein